MPLLLIIARPGAAASRWEGQPDGNHATPLLPVVNIIDKYRVTAVPLRIYRPNLFLWGLICYLMLRFSVHETIIMANRTIIQSPNQCGGEQRFSGKGSQYSRIVCKGSNASVHNQIPLFGIRSIDISFVPIRYLLRRFRDKKIVPYSINIIGQEGVSKSTPSFLYDKAPTFTSWGFVIT